MLGLLPLGLLLLLAAVLLLVTPLPHHPGLEFPHSWMLQERVVHPQRHRDDEALLLRLQGRPSRRVSANRVCWVALCFPVIAMGSGTLEPLACHLQQQAWWVWLMKQAVRLLG